MAQAVAESALSALLEIEDEAARQSAAVWLRQQLAALLNDGNDSEEEGSDGSEEDAAMRATTAIEPHDDNGLIRLTAVKQYLRSVVPPSGIAPGEKIQETGAPEESIDAFLVSTEEVDAMADAGRLSRHVCHACGSRDVADVDFISHSMSMDQLTFLFKQALPALCPKMNTLSLLDVGSRLGAVLYGGHCFSTLGQLVGVELNPFFAKLARDTAHQFGMEDRIQVHEGNIAEKADLLAQADIIVLNNVFEYFGDASNEESMWAMLRRTVTRSGVLLVTVPALSEEQQRGWVTEADVEYPAAAFDGDEYAEEAESLHFYHTVNA